MGLAGVHGGCMGHVWGGGGTLRRGGRVRGAGARWWVGGHVSGVPGVCMLGCLAYLQRWPVGVHALMGARGEIQHRSAGLDTWTYAVVRQSTGSETPGCGVDCSGLSGGSEMQAAQQWCG